MPELLLSIPLALLIILACHEAGRLILRLLNLPPSIPQPINRAIFKFALGLIAIEFVLSILGITGLLLNWLMWLLLIGLLASALKFGRESISSTVSAIKSIWRESIKIPLNAILVWVIVLTLLMDFILTMVPTTAWDALTYHYPLPMQWIRDGGFVFNPGNCYSELPMASEMMFAFAFGLGGISDNGLGAGHLAANHLTWFAGFLSILGFMAIGRKIGPSLVPVKYKAESIWNSWTPGLLASVAFLSLPIVFVEEMEGGYIENFIVFLSVAILIALLYFRDTKSEKLIAIVGILSGGLLASKHSNIFLCALVVIILIIWIVNSRDRPGLRYGWKFIVFAILLAILIPFPWWLKSYIHTGDPAWPFLTKLLNPDAMVPDIMYWSNPNVERSGWGFITYIARLTWDVSLVQLDFRLLSWYFLPLLPFAVHWTIADKNARPIGIITWLLILVIYLLAPGEPRYLLAVWGLYIILGAWSLLRILNVIPKVTGIILPILLILPIGFSLVARTGEINKRIPTIIGMASIEDYFEKSYDIWDVVNYINEETEEDARIVLIEPRNMYVERDFTIWYPFPTGLTEDWGRIDYRNLYSSWLGDEIDYIVLTFGPNFRALSMVHFKSNPEALQYPENIPDYFTPWWLRKQAAYLEPNLQFPESNESEYRDPPPESRINSYDILSMHNLTMLAGEGYIVPVYLDEYAGLIYRIVPHDEIEVDTE